MKFLVLQHINIEHPGIFLKFMKEDNVQIDTVELDENEKIPQLNKYDAMIVMGGPMDTWQEETYPWLKPEKEEIHKFACVQKKPFLGLCLGAQLLSEAVGGKVRKMKTPEIGVLGVSLADSNSLFKGLNKELKALWIIGEDVVQTDPNSAHVAKAMNALDLLVVQEIFMSETAKHADVVLPGTTFLEKDGTFTNTERRVQKVNKAAEPLPGTKPDGLIVTEMMQKLGYDL